MLPDVGKGCGCTPQAREHLTLFTCVAQCWQLSGICRLEPGSCAQATQILEELQPHALALMTDQFGNYVIQKLLDHGGEDVRAALGKELQGRVLELTVNTFGCRIVQKALEVLRCPSAQACWAG